MKFDRRYLYPFLACTIWGSLYFASRIVLQTVPPVTVQLFRYIFGCAALGIVALVRKCMRPIPRKDWGAFLIIGVIAYFLSNVFQIMGTARVGASLSSLINALPPVTIPVMAALILKEKLTGRRVAAMVISIAGVYIVLGVNTAKMDLDPLGTLCCFGCLFFFSFGSVVMRRISGGYDPVQITLVGMLIALTLNIPAAALELRTASAEFSPVTFGCLAYMGVFGSAVAHAFWNKGLKVLDAGTCSMFYPFQPVTTCILSMLILGEVLTVNFFVGAGIICVGILVGLVQPVKKKI